MNPILFPLAGTPILAYTLEFLERGGVEDIILICSRQTNQLKSYLASSRWGEVGYPVKVRLVTAVAARSTGDALREVDRLGLIKADFVLIRGGLLSNLPLPSIMEEHRRRKEDDKDALLMTIVLMQTDTHAAFSHRRYYFVLFPMLTRETFTRCEITHP
jgi:translation initiation factor eIF-2B subunit epsilon